MSPNNCSAQPALRLTGLHYRFAGCAPLFDQLSVDLPPGVTWLTGDEGCGKTTLLRLLAGPRSAQHGHGQWLHHPTGPLTPADVAWHDPSDEALDQQVVRRLLEKAQMSQISQEAQGIEGTALPPGGAAQIAHWVAGLSLAEHLDKPLYQLSTGGRRKALMAASMIQHRRLTLLDQPFSALDRPSIDFLLAALAQADTRTGRLWLVADHVPPPLVPLASTWRLPDARTTRA